MRTPRYLRPIHVSEFTALVLKVSLMEEVGRLTLAQDAARDSFDLDWWAMLEAKLSELRSHLSDIRIGLAVLGPTPPEMLEEYARDIHRVRHFMPRSRANREQWDAWKKEERAALREHQETVRETIRAERAARAGGGKAEWKAPGVEPSGA